MAGRSDAPGDAPGRSSMGAAITYAQNQWAALCVYATQGFLAIDNNTSERALSERSVIHIF
ncbi:MAG: IS66 family transposase [Lacipirellulaceae bacterium]